MHTSPHIRLLGGFSLAFNGVAIRSLNTPRLQSLLAYLLLNSGRPQSRQQIAFLLWPETSEAQAQTNLRQLVHRLRVAVPELEPYILVSNRTLEWNSTKLITFDVSEFGIMLAQAHRLADGPFADRLRLFESAVELYGGDLLPGLYDEWLVPERESLRQKYIDTLEALATELGQQGRHQDGLAYAERLRKSDPLRESTYRTLMDLCVAMKDYSGAARYYQECTAILERELGVQPGPTTQAKYRHALAMAAESQPDYSREEVEIERKRKSTTRALSNLPAQPNSFIGRLPELVVINSLLRQDVVRLLTLTGAPGVGKTRLALQAAAGLITQFSDGVFLIPLAPVSDPALIGPLVAHALEVNEAASGPVERSVIEWVGDKKLLLVLDNFEHLLEAGALVSSLLANCPNLKALVTSREKLQIYGEHEFAVPPLEMPQSDEIAEMTVDWLSEFAAIRLFWERARAVKHDFMLSPAIMAQVVAICRKLDGLPLAIELAASRVKQLPPQALLQRLDQRLNALTVGPRDLPMRHRTLRAAIEWSYDLLQLNEQRLFLWLGVFAGGSTLEAVEAVCGGLQHSGTNIELVDALESLVSKNLVRREEGSDGEGRFVMLETVREYAIEQLQAATELAEMRKRHAYFFLGMAEKAEHELAGPDQHLWLKYLEVEHGNFRGAIQWSLQAVEITTALQLTGALLTFWERRAYLVEGREWAEKALAMCDEHGEPEKESNTDPAALRAKVLTGLSLLAQRQGDNKAARGFITESLELYQALHDKHGIANALNNLGLVAADQFELSEARDYYERSLALRRELGDKRGIALSLHNLGILYNRQGEYEAARKLHNESLMFHREVGDQWGIASALYMLADLAANQWEDYSLASDYFSESLEIYRILESKWAIAWVLCEMGTLARYQEDYKRARSFYDESLLIFKHILSKPGMAFVYIGLGKISLRQGEQPESRSYFSQGLSLLYEMGNTRGILDSIVGLARLLAEQKLFYRAGLLLGWAQRIFENPDIVLDSADMHLFSVTLSVVRSHLDEKTWDEARAHGRQMTNEEVLAEALRESSPET